MAAIINISEIKANGKYEKNKDYIDWLISIAQENANSPKGYAMKLKFVRNGDDTYIPVFEEENITLYTFEDLGI